MKKKNNENIEDKCGYTNVVHKICCEISFYSILKPMKLLD